MLKKGEDELVGHNSTIIVECSAFSTPDKEFLGGIDGSELTSRGRTC